MRRWRTYGFVATFLAVPLMLYTVFVISPYVQAFQLSLTSWNGYSSVVTHVGLDNFGRLLGDAVFWQALRNHGIMLLTLPVVTIAIALFLAFLLNLGGGPGGDGMRGLWGSRFYRVVFFFPQVLAVAVVGVLFQAIYRPDEVGVINGVLARLGIEPVGWLIEPSLALWSVIAVMVWQGVGFYVVLFSAGMAAIPKDYFEAAALDGAGRVRLFFSITLPLLRDTVQVGWIYLGIAALDGFALIQVLAGDKGEPDGATTILPVTIYNTAFSYQRVGYASAMGVALFFLTVTFAVLTLRTTRRERVEL
ncbi:sugar ABC transporter permease [Nonomuraea terrae]|uniref:Sugar ABC transporter permease n=1 Tax=Nonomuraea terrae TaxID=2530383 RepID=A0A4V2YKI6_9ACTN|nr:sugar ABC transporter permease [Nonomuraea terrae]TDD42877.1 sugar ABC transporter permease [Nonomuraea terrae]